VEGTGLGLVVAKRLIELMQGHIGVSSIVGKGSTFWIELPQAERPVENLERMGGTKELPPLSANAQTILYVEDNVANFELIQQVLADYKQIKLLWAADAKSGLEMAQYHIPNLILLDLHLGNSDGTDVLRELKKLEKTKHIPVIIVTADATAGQNARLMQMGANAHLTKPLNVKELMTSMEELLSQKEF
jgi:CheY-like chemotaxis protein